VSDDPPRLSNGDRRSLLRRDRQDRGARELAGRDLAKEENEDPKSPETQGSAHQLDCYEIIEPDEKRE
jgi:hypothetical protein